MQSIAIINVVGLTPAVWRKLEHLAHQHTDIKMMLQLAGK